MSPDDERLLQAFQEHALPLEEWNQRTHVAVAWIHLELHGFDEALERLRTGIQQFNRGKGIEESPTSGYNETTTVALLTLIESIRQTYRDVLPTVEGLKLVNTGFAYEHGGPKLERLAPSPGEHTEEVLREAGFSADEIEMLTKAR